MGDFGRNDKVSVAAMRSTRCNHSVRIYETFNCESKDQAFDDLGNAVVIEAVPFVIWGAERTIYIGGGFGGVFVVAREHSFPLLVIDRFGGSTATVESDHHWHGLSWFGSSDNAVLEWTHTIISPDTVRLEFSANIIVNVRRSVRPPGNFSEFFAPREGFKSLLGFLGEGGI